METETTTPTIPAKLAAKLAKARKAAKGVEKKGRNDHHKYDYARAEDVVREAERVLQEEGVLLLPEVVEVVESRPENGGLIVQAHLLYHVVDAETGEGFQRAWIGYGHDKPGDKAIYKAITGGDKYFLAKLLGIPFGQDPEDEGASNGGNGQQQPQPKRSELPKAKVDEIVDAFKTVGADFGKVKLLLGSVGVPAPRTSRADSILKSIREGLTVEKADQLLGLIQREADRASADAEQNGGGSDGE